MSNTFEAAERPSETYASLGPLQPRDISRMESMALVRRIEYLRTIYGTTTLPFAAHQYFLLTGISLNVDRTNRKKVERSTR